MEAALVNATAFLAHALVLLLLYRNKSPMLGGRRWRILVEAGLVRYSIHHESSAIHVVGDHYWPVYWGWIHPHRLLRIVGGFKFLSICVYGDRLVVVHLYVQVYIDLFLLLLLRTHYSDVLVLGRDGFVEMWGSLNFGGTGGPEGRTEGGPDDVLVVDNGFRTGGRLNHPWGLSESDLSLLHNCNNIEK